MAWLVDALRENPALALFAVLAIGFALGQVRVGTFQPGPVLGCLIAGLVIGQLGIKVPGGMKDVFFLLFVFAIGLRTGAEFFRGLRSSALPQLAVIATLFYWLWKLRPRRKPAASYVAEASAKPM